MLFDWTADTWVAIGTLALAAATVYLAMKTGSLSATSQQELDLLRQQAAAAQAQSATAEQALRASIRPVIIDVPKGTLREVRRHDWFWPMRRSGEPRPPETTKVDVSRVRISFGDPDEPQDRELKLDVPIRNVGAGLALIQRAVLHANVDCWTGRTSQQNLPVGEVAAAYFDTPEGSQEYEATVRVTNAKRPLTLEIVYTDLAGGQTSHSFLHLASEPALRDVEDEPLEYVVESVEVTFES